MNGQMLWIPNSHYFFASMSTPHLCNWNLDFDQAFFLNKSELFEYNKCVTVCFENIRATAATVAQMMLKLLRAAGSEIFAGLQILFRFFAWYCFWLSMSGKFLTESPSAKGKFHVVGKRLKNAEN